MPDIIRMRCKSPCPDLSPKAPFATSVPYMREEVEYIIGSRIAEVAARRDAGMVCEITGAPLVNAVRLDDGRMVMERQAILMNECTHDGSDSTTQRGSEPQWIRIYLLMNGLTRSLFCPILPSVPVRGSEFPIDTG